MGWFVVRWVGGSAGGWGDRCVDGWRCVDKAIVTKAPLQTSGALVDAWIGKHAVHVHAHQPAASGSGSSQHSKAARGNLNCKTLHIYGAVVQLMVFGNINYELINMIRFCLCLAAFFQLQQQQSTVRWCLDKGIEGSACMYYV